MKINASSRLLPIFLVSLTFALCTETSPTDLEVKTRMLVRTWTGEEFFTITRTDSAFLRKDYVATFDFRNDGSYFLFKYSMSGPGKVGQWKLEDNGNRISLAEGESYSEVFPILELNTGSLVLGDTTSRGYSLVPAS